MNNYNKRNNCSTKNTVPQLATATMIRLFLLQASSTPTRSPLAPLILFSVAYKIAGNVIAVKQAVGT